MPSKLESICTYCNIKFIHSHSSYGKYCSNRCQQDYQNKIIIENWLEGNDKGYKVGYRIKKPIRDFLLKESNYSCSECGWNKVNPKSGTIPLEIDHIDGDCTNNKKENLKVLCPNCHSLTPTWKALNTGNGNKISHRYSGLVE